MKLLFIFLFSLLIQESAFSEESFIMPEEVESTASNGTLFIQNGVVNRENENDTILKVDTEGTDIKRVIIKHVKINSNNARINGSGDQSGLVEVYITDNSNFEAKNLKINSGNSRIHNTSTSETGCAAAYCFKIDEGSKDNGSDVTVNATGNNEFTSIIK